MITAGPVPERQEGSGAVTASDPGAGTDVLAAWMERTGRRARKPERAGLRFAFTVTSASRQSPWAELTDRRYNRLERRKREEARTRAAAGGRGRVTIPHAREQQAMGI